MASLWDNVRQPNLKVREKLSSLVRRGSLRSIKTKASGHGGATAHAAPILEVDLERVKSLRLADGWLEEASPPSPARPSSKRRNGRGRRGADGARESERETELRRYSSTPIADLFSMSTDRLASTLETISRKPVPVSQPARLTAAPPRPAPPESEQLPVVRISLRHSVVEGDDTPTLPPSRASVDGASRRHSIQQVNLLRSVGTNTTGLRVSANGGGDNRPSGAPGIGVGVNPNPTNKRYSASSIPSLAVTPEMPPPARPPVLEIKTSEARPEPSKTAASSTTPLETRRRSWQPTRAASPAPTPATPTANPAPQRTPSTRPPSAALNSSRLAWIRELENKSSQPSSSSASRNKASSGGVASKLAMFENIQTRTSKPKQLSAAPAPLSRSNTTSSRVSSGGTSFGFSGEASVSTARTSFDSDSFSTTSGIRSKRSSLVMAYYDEGFREKMEGVVAKQLKTDEKEGEETEEATEDTKDVKMEEAVKGQDEEINAEDVKADAEEKTTAEPEVKVEVPEANAEQGGAKGLEEVALPAEADGEKSIPAPTEPLPADTLAVADADAETTVKKQSEPEPVQVEAEESVVINDVTEVSPQGPIVELAGKEDVTVQVGPQEEESPKITSPQGALEGKRDEVMVEPAVSTSAQDDGRSA